MRQGPTDPKVVVKVGGSLLLWPEFPPRLEAYLETLKNDHPVLVVGGGPAADFIREVDSAHELGEERSHALAIRTLDLTAHVLASLIPGLCAVSRPKEIPNVFGDRLIPVFAPRWFLDNVDRGGNDPLKASWEVTTDSIAARIAESLGADRLVLLKSTDAKGAKSAKDAAKLGVVDASFPEISARIKRVELVNFRANPRTLDVLNPA